ncbi:MAG: CHASE2 domain-containing protein [Elusimicrobiota bacterium]
MDSGSRKTSKVRGFFGFEFWFSLALSLVFLLLEVNPISGRRFGIFYGLESIGQDFLFELNRSSLRAPDSHIVVVAVDDAAGQKFGFPLPRREYSILLKRLKALGVKTAAFDIIFLDPGDPAIDDALGRAAARFGDTIFGMVVYLDGHVDEPIEPIRRAAKALGNVDSTKETDPDGHIRWADLVEPGVSATAPGSEDEFPSLGLAAYAEYSGTPMGSLMKKYGAPNFTMPPINFRPPLSAYPENGQWPVYRRISIVKILEGKLNADEKAELKGALVFVGSTSLGYYDHSPTPFLTQAPGVEINANIADNLIHGDFMRVWSGWPFAVALLLMIWIPVFLMRLPASFSLLLSAGLAAGWLFFIERAFLAGERIDFVAPLIALAASFSVLMVRRVLAENREKRFIKSLFGQFVAPEIVEDLARNPDKVRLGGEKREMTILFLDIAHFTMISEKMEPQDLIEFLNRYLSELSGAIYEWRAVVGNYIGDCIMAFWNAPVLPDPEHQAKACLAALKCVRVLGELNKTFEGSGVPEKPAIRIGINSGIVTVGLTGSDRKLQYTALGDEVNLASRLEGANKFFGSSILVSHPVYQGAREKIEARELGRVRVVGKETSVLVYEVLCEKGSLSAERQAALADYERGLAAFKARQWQTAAQAFSRAVDKYPDDQPAKLYLNMSRDYSAVPPLESWDGVFNLTAK